MDRFVIRGPKRQQQVLQPPCETQTETDSKDQNKNAEAELPVKVSKRPLPETDEKDIIDLSTENSDAETAEKESDPTETLISPAKRQKIPDNSGPSSSSSINTVLKSPNLVSNPSKPSSTPTPHKPDKSATGWTANTNKSLAKRSTKTKAKPRKKKEPYVPSVAAQEAAQTVQAASFEELTNKTYAELKGICTDLGLPRGGYKVEIVRRLKNDHLIDTILTTGLGKKHTKEGTKKLVKERLGVSPSKCSKCFLQAVSKGFINLEVESPLDAVVAKTISLCCSKDITVRVRDIMYQKDSPGMDYADGGQNASVFCPECEAGVYITGMCEGQFSPDCWKIPQAQTKWQRLRNLLRGQ